jgi:hypothetical protein
LYEGHPVAEWGYEFISAENGIPFSQEIDLAIDFAVGLDQLNCSGPLMVLSREGIAELAELSQFEMNRDRERYLAGATDCLLVLNPGSVREAFNYDPAINFLRSGHRTAWLLTDPVVERFYSNFHQLREALAYDAHDLSVPFVTWLKYLISTGRTETYDSYSS